MGPSLQSLCPGGCRGISADPGADLGKLVAQLRADAAAGLRLRRARALAPRQDHADGAVRPDAADRLPARRCARRSRPRVHAGAEGRRRAARPPHPRIASASTGFGSPRDFSVARYATVCETTPLPWDAGTPIERARRSRSSGSPRCRRPRSRRSIPPIVVEDEIDLCLRWPDVPRPVLDVPPPPYPTVPTLILQGARGPPHPAGVVAAASRRGSRARTGSSSPASATRPSATRAAAPPTRSCASSRQPHAAEVVQARPDRRAGGAVGARVVRVAARRERLPAQGRPDAAGRAGDDRRPRPRALPGDADRQRRWPARRLVGDRGPPAHPARLPGRHGRDRQRRGRPHALAHVPDRGHQGRQGNARAEQPRARSAGPAGSGSCCGSRPRRRASCTTTCGSARWRADRPGSGSPGGHYVPCRGGRTTSA